MVSSNNCGVQHQISAWLQSQYYLCEELKKGRPDYDGTLGCWWLFSPPAWVVVEFVPGVTWEAKHGEDTDLKEKKKNIKENFAFLFCLAVPIYMYVIFNDLNFQM